MTTLRKIQLFCMAVALAGFIWLTVEVFSLVDGGPGMEPGSLREAALLTWAGLLGNAACALARLWRKNRS